MALHRGRHERETEKAQGQDQADANGARLGVSRPRRGSLHGHRVYAGGGPCIGAANGCPVREATGASAAGITTGNVLIFRKARKHAFGPGGDSLDDFG